MNFDDIGQILDEFDQRLVEIGMARLARFGRIRARLGPELGQFRPLWVNFGQARAAFDPLWANFGKLWAGVDQLGEGADRIWANVDQFWAEIGLNVADVGRGSAKSAETGKNA